jgi:acetyl esterase/lipase
MGSGASYQKEIQEATSEQLKEAYLKLDKESQGMLANSLKLAGEKEKLAKLWDYTPKGKRNDDVQKVWDMVSAGWKDVKVFDQNFLDTLRAFVPMMDQTPEAVLEKVTVEEVEIKVDGIADVEGGIITMKAKVYIPKTLEGVEDRPGQLFCEGCAFVMKGMNTWNKRCAQLAVLSNSVTLYPMDTLSGPENKAETWRKCTDAALRWIHDNAETYKIDRSRVAIYGTSSGAWAAMDQLRRLAEQDDMYMVKLAVLDIPAMDNDFVKDGMSPDKEENEMHKACSMLHMQAWATIFTDIDKVAEHKWYEDDPEVFPTTMADHLLARLPKIAITTAEFDHVGLRGAQRFAETLKNYKKLVGLYIQPGCGHECYGSLQGERDDATALIYRCSL